MNNKLDIYLDKSIQNFLETQANRIPKFSDGVKDYSKECKGMTLKESQLYIANKEKEGSLKFNKCDSKFIGVD